jgi:hypothetical protein
MLTMDKNWLTYNRVKEARKKWLHILCDHSRNAVKGTQRTYMVLGWMGIGMSGRGQTDEQGEILA